jgi:hypothetical protein
VAAENFQSTTYVGRIEETTAEGVTTRTIERDVVQYGIAVLLEPIVAWLDEVVAPRARVP